MERITFLCIFFISFLSDIYCKPQSQGRRFSFDNGQRQIDSELPIRLAGGRSGSHEGFLEVKLYGGGPWQLICNDDYSFNYQAADVACHQMGYDLGAHEFKRGQNQFADLYSINSPTNVNPLHIDCKGYENDLFLCDYQVIRNGNQCNKFRHAVAVVCKRPSISGPVVRSTSGCLLPGDIKGVDYKGTTSRTLSGMNCLPWNTPSLTDFLPVQAKLENWSHNYCRNDGTEDAPFCFIQGGEYEECNIPRCGITNICSNNQFQCRPGECILRGNVCDGRNDCSNSMDEKNCDRGPTTEVSFTNNNLRLENEGGIDIVNVKIDGQWGSVCAETITSNEADVICKQLGFEYSERILKKQVANGYDHIVLFSMTCNGDENNINDCRFNERINNQQFCSGNQKAGVKCYGQSASEVSGKIHKIDLSLHNDLRCGGDNIYIELNQGVTSCQTSKKGAFDRGTILSWTGSNLGSCIGKDFSLEQENIIFKIKTTSGDDFCPKSLTISMNNGPIFKKSGMDDWVDENKGGHNRIAQLLPSVGTPLSLIQDYLACHEVDDFQCKNKECIDINLVCDGQSQCSDGSDEDRNLCNQPLHIKLVGGPNDNTGRVLVRHRGVWGTICDDHFGNEEAKVICRMLQLPTSNAKVYKKTTDYHDKGPVWIHFDEDNNCNGNESSITECKQTYLWDHDFNCEHVEDVAVTCE